ncbi:MAG: ATP-dependent helicase HrpB [Gammaproteobacteria bacterium]|nr:ATP-dependent helicase HrpB [Gammaproteobacteria bacterium]
MEELPVQEVITSLSDALRSSGRALLSAPPGSGKTTVVPLQLLREPWLHGSILMLEPRRLAARAAASRMAWLSDEKVGQLVGYQVRLDRRVSKATRIEVVTEGILTRRLQQDPELQGVGLVIFDEFHERSLQADLALALCLDVAGSLREDLRLLVMSATLDTLSVSRLLGDAPVISATGKSYPVAVNYLERGPRERKISQEVVRVICQVLQKEEGDILVFLPGAGEIHATQAMLSERLDAEFLIYPLYGNLDSAAQDRAILPDPKGRRRVILATSIAETSLTIEGVKVVVDSGLARQPRFDPNTGLTRLVTLKVSAAAAKQRCGRAGRLGPGVCYRLWTQAVQSRLQPHMQPEILDADLSFLVLELALWGVGDAADLCWLDAPPAGAFAQARDLLQALGALNKEGQITAAGRRMAAVPAHPRLAHMLDKAGHSGQVGLAADLAAILSERDVLRKGPNTLNSVDIEDRLALLQRWRGRGRRELAEFGADVAACARVVSISRQLQKVVNVVAQAAGSPSRTLSPGVLLADAYPDRIARRRGSEQNSYLMSSGRAVGIPEGDSLSGEEYLVIPSLDAGRSEGRAFLAARVTPDQLRRFLGSQITFDSVITWESRSQSVVARKEERLGAIELSVAPLSDPDPAKMRKAMLDGIKSLGIEVLPWGRSVEEWRGRLLSLRHWQPDSFWPDLSDETLSAGLDAWLEPWLQGITRRDHLRKLGLKSILSNGLDWKQRQRMDQLAPTHVQVPSGANKRLGYQPGMSPVLQVRLQEMFGLMDTPRVCDGQVPVTLHLLSPAQRPIQITQDLRGFWERTYQEVRKELKGRYPKHYWPEDPLVAQATTRIRPGRGK